MSIKEQLEKVEKGMLAITDMQLKLKNILDDVKTKVKEEEHGQDWPQAGDLYYFIDDEGVVIDSSFYNDNCDKARKAIGDFFRTKEEAEFEAERLKVIAELKQFSSPFKAGAYNYYINYQWGHDVLECSFNFHTQRTDLFFESEEKAQEAIASVGKERILKYYFRVEGRYDE